MSQLFVNLKSVHSPGANCSVWGLCYITKEAHICKDMFTGKFVIMVFIIAKQQRQPKTWKHPKCLSLKK